MVSHDGDDAEDETQTAWVTVLDSATGREKAHWQTVGRVGIERWRNTWAVVARSQEESQPDPLKPVVIDRHVRAWDFDGHPLADLRWPKDDDDQTTQLDQGWLVRSRGSSITVTPAGQPNAPERRYSCNGCTFGLFPDGSWQLNLDEYHGGAPLFAAGYLVLADTTPSNRYLRLVDPETGRLLLDSATAKRPPGAVPSTGRNGLAVGLGTVGDRVDIGWASRTGKQGWLPAVYDPATGDLTASAPVIHHGGEILVNDDNTVAVTSTRNQSGGDQRSSCWNPATGQLYWEQSGEEHPLIPQSVVGDVVYGNVPQLGEDDATLAVDARSRKVLLTDLKDASIPLTDGHGHVIVVYQDVAYGFTIHRG